MISDKRNICLQKPNVLSCDRSGRYIAGTCHRIMTMPRGLCYLIDLISSNRLPALKRPDAYIGFVLHTGNNVFPHSNTFPPDSGEHIPAANLTLSSTDTHLRSPSCQYHHNASSFSQCCPPSDVRRKLSLQTFDNCDAMPIVIRLL